MSITIGVIEPGREPYKKEIQGKADDRGGGCSYLAAFQSEVGGLIEYFEPLFGDNPALIVNEEFLYNGSTPNRAIYANERIHEMGYLDMMTYSHVPDVGDLYGLIFGTFIAVSYDEDGNPQNMPDDEWKKVCDAFCGIRSVLSGMVEVTRIRASNCTEHIKVNLPESEEGYEHANGEGVWLLVDERTKAAHDNDVESGYYFGILDNDSFCWPGLNHGEPLPFEMRGVNRPIVPLAWLSESYREILGNSNDARQAKTS